MLLLLGASTSFSAIPPRIDKSFQKSIFLNSKGTLMGTERKFDALSNFNNWMNLSPEDGFQGMNVDKAYKRFNLQGKKTIVVAVIDSGVDIFHEEFKTKGELERGKKIGSRIWKNRAEIMGKPGVDDDNNGYIDDKYGWNFAGKTTAEGRAVSYENDTLEVTREYKRYLKKLRNNEPMSERRKAYYQEVEKAYKSVADLMKVSYKIMRNQHNESDIAVYKRLVTKKFGAKYADISYASAIYNHMNQSKHLYDLKAKPLRSDNPSDFRQKGYGNNDVKGPDSSHGTHVAGIIAGVRDNGNVMQGVATKVKIMSLRAVPNGDERDKDVAMAIRYAADNGAHIINMSFGKDYSPYKKQVDRAIDYAIKKGVLLFHSAGNSSKDLDKVFTFPNQFRANDRSNRIMGMITVGASDASIKINRSRSKSLAADFTNHGNTAVDLFAPGVDIYSSVPGNRYDQYSGTSMAGPAAAGAAALILSEYPKIKNVKLQKLLMDSVRTYRDLDVLRPGTGALMKFSAMSTSNGIVDVYKAFNFLQR